jgi:hypothetical protein
MFLKGTQRRLAVSFVALSALTPLALAVRPAGAAFPPGHAVSNFNYKFVASTHIKKLKQTISPAAGSFKGGIDRVTGQLAGAIKLPNTNFVNKTSGLSATASMVQTKAVSGRMTIKNSKVTATSTFVLHIVSAYVPSAAARPALDSSALPTLPVTLPTLPITLPSLPITLPPLSPPPFNMVGTDCATAPISVVMSGIAHAGSPTTFTGTYTIPKFTSCGTLTALLNKLIPGPGNTFTAVATPTSGGGGSSGPTLPSLPITLPSLPITLPTLPVTLPTLPVTLPTLPTTLPTLPITLPTLPITLPTLPVTLPSTPG